jgi:hypothetical protein
VAVPEHPGCPGPPQLPAAPDAYEFPGQIRNGWIRVRGRIRITAAEVDGWFWRPTWWELRTLPRERVVAIEHGRTRFHEVLWIVDRDGPASTPFRPYAFGEFVAVSSAMGWPLRRVDDVPARLRELRRGPAPGDR